MERKCENCVLRKNAEGICPIFHKNTEGEAGCPYFSSDFVPCDICGGHIMSTAILEVDKDGAVHQMCQNCAQLPLCATCINKDKCAFQTDTSCAAPHMITTQERRGNVVLQTQKINPERVNMTCAKGCICYQDNHCLKNDGVGCNNYKTNWRN